MFGNGIHPKECTICGDVGFPDALLLCNICGFRFQHTYCSRFYPNLVVDSLACEWCLYEQRQKNNGNRNLSENTRNRTAFEFLLQIAQSFRDQCIRGEINENKSCKNGKPAVSCGRGDINVELPSSDGCRKDQFELKHNLDEDDLHRNYKQERNSTSSAGQCPKKPCADVYQTSNRKRARSAAERWGHLRRNKLHCIKINNSKAAIGQRYKLLADVLY